VQKTGFNFKQKYQLALLLVLYEFHNDFEESRKVFEKLSLFKFYCLGKIRCINAWILFDFV